MTHQNPPIYLSQPYASPSALRSSHTNDLDHVTTIQRWFTVEHLPDDYPYRIPSHFRVLTPDESDSNISREKIWIPFWELQGRGRPVDGHGEGTGDSGKIGIPGDVYVNLDKSDSTYYVKSKTAWIRWDPTSPLVQHPHFEGLDLYFWCQDRTPEWTSRDAILSKLWFYMERNSTAIRSISGGSIPDTSVTMPGSGKPSSTSGSSNGSSVPRLELIQTSRQSQDPEVSHHPEKCHPNSDADADLVSVHGQSTSRTRSTETTSPLHSDGVQTFSDNQEMASGSIKEMQDTIDHLREENIRLRDVTSTKAHVDVCTSPGDFQPEKNEAPGQQPECQIYHSGLSMSPEHTDILVSAITGRAALKALGLKLEETKLEMKSKLAASGEERRKTEQCLRDTTVKLEQERRKVSTMEGNMAIACREFHELQDERDQIHQKYQQLSQVMSQMKATMNV